MNPLHATIEELAADGYTHVECRNAPSGQCPRLLPFVPADYFQKSDVAQANQQSWNDPFDDAGCDKGARPSPLIAINFKYLHRRLRIQFLKASELPRVAGIRVGRENLRQRPSWWRRDVRNEHGKGGVHDVIAPVN